MFSPVNGKSEKNPGPKKKAEKTEVFDRRVSNIITAVNEDDIDDNEDVITTKFNKNELLGAVRTLSDDNNELLKLSKQNNIIGEPIMDEKDLKLMTNDFKTMLDDKFKSEFDDKLDKKLDTKFGSLESDLKGIKENSEKACVGNDCFANKLDELSEKINGIDTLKDDINGFKSDINGFKSDINGEIKGVTNSVSGMDEKFNKSISNINDKLGETCTGIDCLNKRFEQEDDMIECPACGHMFSLTENTLGDIIICPSCQAKLQ